MIAAWKTIADMFCVNELSPTFKLFSYGAAFPRVVREAFPSATVEIYGSGRTFSEDLQGFGVPPVNVRVFKSTGDRHCPYGEQDDDEPHPVMCSEQSEQSERSEYTRMTLRVFEGFSESIQNVLIIQPGRKQLIKDERFDDIHLTHAKLGGAFLIS